MKFRPRIEVLELRETPSSLNGPGAVVLPTAIAGPVKPAGWENNAAQTVTLPPTAAAHNPHGAVLSVGSGQGNGP
jgi:hypothetical protein